MQVCHGKVGPLRRMQPGDVVAYYSPVGTFRGKDKLQTFTAIGVVRVAEPYTFDMGGGFCPARRDVDWWPSRDTPIGPLLGQLTLTADKRNWGYVFRFGLVEIGARDMAAIASAMGVDLALAFTRSAA